MYFMKGNCWASPGDLISQPRVASRRIDHLGRPDLLLLNVAKNNFRQQKIIRFCYIVAKNGSVTKSNKKAELAGDSPETSPESS
jgi:hypothetical protein